MFEGWRSVDIFDTFPIRQTQHDVAAAEAAFVCDQSADAGDLEALDHHQPVIFP